MQGPCRASAITTLAALAGCGLVGGGAPPAPAPALSVPERSLDFGRVYVAAERTQHLRVDNRGLEPLAPLEARLDDPSGAFSFAVPPILSAGLPAGAHAFVELNFRACPEAWTEGGLDPAYDLAACPLDEVTATLELANEVQVELHAGAGLAPSARLECPLPSPVGGCPSSDAPMGPCEAIDFGVVGLEEACEVPLELVNTRGAGGPTADLEVHEAVLRLRSGDGALDGSEAGLALLDEAGEAIVPTRRAPLIVPAPEARPEARRRIRLRFTSARGGVFAGEPERGAGLRFGTNAPEQPNLQASLYAEGVVPTPRIEGPEGDLELRPAIGETEVRTLELVNDGPGVATLEEARFFASRDSLTLLDAPAPGPLPPGASRAFRIRYARRAAGFADATLSFRFRSPIPPVGLRINAFAGPSSTCEVSPVRIDFGAQAGGRREAAVSLRAVGAEPCAIERLDIEPAPGTLPGEFFVDAPGCATLPCAVDLYACAAADPGCGAPEVRLPVLYENQDLSARDAATLVLRGLDGALRQVPLLAEDPSCAPPAPVIEVRTPAPCVGAPLRLDGAASVPGGPSGGRTAIVAHRWSFSTTQLGPPAPTDRPTLELVPAEAGPQIFELAVQNDCGAWSEGRVAVTVDVAAACE